MADRILIVEDEENIASFVRLYLEKAGFSVEHVTTGAAGVVAATTSGAALVLLDLNLPDMDGLEVCRRVRATSNVPMVMLTARDDDIDKIVGLEVGADDYVTKPFNPRELVARIKTILRRVSAPPPPSSERTTLSYGRLRIDAPRREVTVDGAEIALAPKEFDLLYALVEHRGLVLSRDQLLERVWGYTFAGDTRTVDVHVRQVRRKVGEACGIVTVWGVGYKVADDAPSS